MNHRERNHREWKKDSYSRDDSRRFASRKRLMSRRLQVIGIVPLVSLLVAGVIFSIPKTTARPVVQTATLEPLKKIERVQLKDVILAKDKEVYEAWVTDEVPPTYLLERRMPDGKQRTISANYNISTQEWVNTRLCGEFPSLDGMPPFSRFDCMDNVKLEDDDELRLSIAFAYAGLRQFK